MPKDLAGGTNGGCGSMACFHDGTAVKNVVSKYLQGSSLWNTQKQRNLNLHSHRTCHFYLVPDDFEVYDAAYIP